MDEIMETPIRRPVRRRKTKMERFKENSLPYLILLTAAVLILIFIIGASVRNAKASSSTSDTAQTALCYIAEC